MGYRKYLIFPLNVPTPQADEPCYNSGTMPLVYNTVVALIQISLYLG